MPLRKINKIIGQNAIKDFNLKDNPAIKYLLDQNNFKRKITIEDLGFLIGPIINAGGRLNYSNYGVELLSSDDQTLIEDKSKKLIKLNEKRKKIEKDILDQINFEKIKKENNNVIIYYNKSLN
jgi:single-stranded-DNA-specific exonuclease